MSELINAVKTQGMRMTPQRAIIFEAIEKLEGHMTAEDIFAEVQQINPYINLATIYRTLELLQELDLMTQTNLGRGRTFFALKDHCSHHHLVCEVCGGVEEFCDDVLEPVREALAEQYRFEAHTDHLSVFGICQKCRQKNSHTD
jgi:Fur family ferric uptake transcriptional regulator